MEEQLPEKQLDVSSILTFAKTIGGVDRLHLLRFSILTINQKQILRRFGKFDIEINFREQDFNFKRR
jgi:hypothetical protein